MIIYRYIAAAIILFVIIGGFILMIKYTMKPQVDENKVEIPKKPKKRKKIKMVYYYLITFMAIKKQSTTSHSGHYSMGTFKRIYEGKDIARVTLDIRRDLKISDNQVVVLQTIQLLKKKLKIIEYTK